MAIFKAHSKPGKLKHSIIYADKDRRRENDYNLTIGINCSKFCNIAILEMQKVKELYDKTGGRECQHYILSFAKDEITLPNAMEYVKAHAEKCFGDRFQVFVGIHVNSESKCIHAHYIVNSVSFVDGGKIQTSKNDYNRFRDYNDELAREYGLKVIDRSPNAVAKRGRPQLYSMQEYQLHKKVALGTKKFDYSYVNNCFSAVMNCIDSKPKNFTNFVLKLKQEGWLTTLRGKNIVFMNSKNLNQRVRANTLAKKYNIPTLSSLALLRNLNYDFTSDNYFIRNHITYEKTKIETNYENNKSTSIFTSLPKISCHNDYNHYGKKTNKMRVRLYNDEYENDDYSL